MADPATPGDSLAWRRLERRFARERTARSEAETIAEDATRRLYREQIKLEGILQVATRANESNDIEETTRQGLASLTEHTVWKCAHIFYRDPSDRLSAVAWVDHLTGSDASREAPWTTCGQELLNQANGVRCEFFEEPPFAADASASGHGLQHCCICSISVHGRCFGLIEAFSNVPDRDQALSREFFEGIAQTLGYVYKREHDRRMIEHMAYHDPLTGLGNRAQLFDHLDLAIRRARREQHKVAVMAINVDRFRDINDSAGTRAGDAFLVELAQRIQSSIRDIDTVARLGGDEFMIVFDGLGDSEDITTLGQRLLRNLTPEALNPKRATQTPTQSAGVAIYPDDARDAEGLAHCAETAMQRAKAEGGDRLVAYDPALAQRNEQRRQLEQQVRAAAEQGAFASYYQPLVELPSERVIGAEALLRWQMPDAPGPDVFIPILERLGLMHEVGTQVLRTALQHASQWLNEGRDLQRISVNVSPVQLQDDRILGTLDQILAETGLPADRVCLEITENVYLEGDEHIRTRMAALRARGIAIALDDFGTGYSSLGYLQWLSLDTLKIDKSFVFGVADQKHHLNLVRSIIGIAEALELAVTAEGIETPEIARLIAALGCTYGQGYHYGRAMPGDELWARLAWPRGPGYIPGNDPQ
ncbi:bifunctional diguanylate cyclase/phosphodiesterase [Thioalkalivibrio sp. ALJ1]|uniref:putative bifunctional diguanylate cyclase/phosphodiesterase n=1 Tax=Thioalkalivibrio sp. ALJ1 TaxID=1158144 RepID=UPI000570E78C|nr:bifunctional diguanylate cyclase/phosphodiesterase [Thioalkalivibrio sp. ALJ1]